MISGHAWYIYQHFIYPRRDPNVGKYSIHGAYVSTHISNPCPRRWKRDAFATVASALVLAGIQSQGIHKICAPLTVALQKHDAFQTRLTSAATEVTFKFVSFYCNYSVSTLV